MASFNPALRSSLLLCLYSTLATAASCYNPDGDLILDPTYQPCVQTLGAVSMCCATNRTTNADVCQSNGLCHNPCLASGQECDGSSQGQYWRESCTDQSWSSPYCLSGVCTNIAVSRKWRHWQGCRLMEIDWRVAERKHWNVPVLDRWHLVFILRRRKPRTNTLQGIPNKLEKPELNGGNNTNPEFITRHFELPGTQKQNVAYEAPA
jgi:hypothetical protein